MKAVVQRVSQASVTVADEVVGQIGPGLAVLLGVANGDNETDVQWMAAKLSGLRIFEDADGKMNLSVADVNGAVLVISQFTLLGDCRKGRRPSFIDAAEPALAEKLYQEVADSLEQLGLPVATGRFRANMQVSLINDGPVTLLLDSRG